MDHATERTVAKWLELGREVEHVVIDPAVRAWRYHSLTRAGFTASQAEIVASDADIDEVMSENLCRCGTYQRIRRAIHRAAGEVA